MFLRSLVKSKNLFTLKRIVNNQNLYRSFYIQSQKLLPLQSNGILVGNRTFSLGKSLRSFVEAEPSVDPATYEKVCSETLEALCDYFEEIVENADNLPESDVSYGDGVLTVKLGSQYGTYVINRQTPNKQIWLSSPTSGPKRYDFYAGESGTKGKWVYRHNGEVMHQLLQNEIQKIIKNINIDFHQLPYSS